MKERTTQEINKIWSGIISSEIRQLKEGLGMDESEFHSFDPRKSDKSLQWWMYSVLDDLMRFQIKIIGMEDIFNPEGQITEDEKFPEEIEKGLNLNRLILENYSFELDFWHRKFLEHFIQLIHLVDVSEDDKQIVAKIYLLSGKLLSFANRLKDDNDSYGIKNEAEIQGFGYEFQEIEVLLKKLGSNCIFIETGFNEKDARKFKVFCSYKSLYDEIFKKNLATENDRLLLGGTYHYYHRLTQSIHAHGHSNEENITLEGIGVKISHIFLLSMKILFYIGKISSIKSSLHIKFFAESPLPEGIDFTIQKYEKGDLVIFRGSIYEILDFSKQQNTGYIAYQIQTKSGIGMSVRWVRQEEQYLKRVLYIGNARKLFSSFEDQKDGNINFILSLSDEEIFLSMKATILDLNQKGINVFLSK